MIARELDLDRKSVRRRLQQTEWKPYRRAARADTLLASHAEYLRSLAAEVGCCFQGAPAAGSTEPNYETVERFVRPLRETQLHAAVTRTRFETPSGESQIDWGAGAGPSPRRGRARYVFVLTLGFRGAGVRGGGLDRRHRSFPAALGASAGDMTVQIQERNDGFGAT